MVHGNIDVPDMVIVRDVDVVSVIKLDLGRNLKKKEIDDVNKYINMLVYILRKLIFLVYTKLCV